MRRKTILFLIVPLLCLVAQAQEPTKKSLEQDKDWIVSTIDSVATYMLSLEDAKALALEVNYDLQNASLAIRQAHHAKWEAISAALPQVSARLDYTTFFGSSSTFAMAPGASSTIDFNDTSNGNLTGTMFFSGTYLVGVKLAKLSEELTKINAVKSDLDVKQAVADSYYAILLAEESKLILESNLENLVKVRDQTEQMYKAGVAELTDLDQLTIQVTLLESSLRTTIRQIAVAYDVLKLQIGISPKSEIELTETLGDFFSPDSFYASLLRAFNLKDNVDYQLIQQQELLSEKQVSMAKMEYLPRLSASFNHLEQIVAPNFNLNPKNTLAFQLNIPIFSSGQRKAKVQQAQIDLEMLQNSKAKLSDALLMQDRQIKLNLSTALDQYDAQKKNVEVAKRVYDNYQRKYDAGMISSLDLTTANSNYLDAESSYIRSMLDVLSAYVELEKFYANL